jgi:ketosteroid isomerase-like protein
MKVRLLCAVLLLAACTSAQARITPQDYADIRELYARYAMAQDGGDAKALAALYAPGGTLRTAQTGHKPRAANAALNSQMTEEGRWGWDRHFLTNVQVREDGGAVRGDCTLLLLDSRPNPGFKVHGRTGVYSDQLVKTAAGWRFQERELWMDGETGSPASPKAASP